MALIFVRPSEQDAVANAPFVPETCSRKMVRFCLAQTRLGPPRRKRGGGREERKSRAQRGENFVFTLICAQILSLIPPREDFLLYACNDLEI